MNLCNYKKKKGSLVIEAAVGVMILSLSSAFAVNAHIPSCKAVRERILNEDVTRNIENLKRIREMLLWFEAHYDDVYSSSGKKIIKPEFKTKRLVLPGFEERRR